MMALEETGRTADEAVDAGLRKLGIAREYVLVETLATGARGFLGLGGQEARVRLTVTPGGERLIRARAILQELLTLMSVEAEVRVEEHEGGVRLELSGKDAGLLIGKQGQTLDAVEFLVGRILDRAIRDRTRVVLDVGGYRERRRQQLEQMAFRLARQVRATGEAIVLEPLDASERRIIHLALQGDDQVTTESVGDGRGRRLVIRPAGVKAFHSEQQSI
ncbi:MAG: protein jag [Candidatus Rokubacteria bacterium]|nr:protein jag [Candidatus Rokubacteria bacterium]